MLNTVTISFQPSQRTRNINPPCNRIPILVLSVFGYPHEETVATESASANFMSANIMGISNNVYIYVVFWSIILTLLFIFHLGMSAF